MKKKRFPLLTVLAALTLASLVSCGDTQTGQPVSAESNGIENTADTSAEADPFAGTDFGAKEFLFATENKEAALMQYASIEIYSDGLDGSLINDTVYQRNVTIEDTYNCKILEDRQILVSGVVNKSVMAGETLYDVVMPYMNDSIKNAELGEYVDLLSVGTLNLSDSWWDQRANDNLKLNNKLYMTTGDISILDNDCTMVLFFNKKMAAENDLESPYDAVYNGTWTVDRLFSMSYQLSADLNGDDKMKVGDDQFGFSCAMNAPHSFFFGTGERITTNDADGNLSLTMYNSRSAEALDKILTSCLDKRNLGNAPFDDVTKAFLENRIFCVSWALVDINFIRNAEFDFGILPYPKYDEQQKEYYCLISTGLVPGVSIPITNPDPEQTGTLLEIMASASVDTLTPAYYETALKNRYMRDEESGGMLDIIFSSRVYDFGYIRDIGGLGSLIQSMYGSKKTDFSSMYQQKESQALAALEELTAAFSSLD